jgi:hypothetical protein
LPRGPADLHPALHRLYEVADDEIVGLGEGCERPGLRAHIAELDGALLRPDGRGEEGRCGKRRAGRGRAL